jgi:hypothetical protein
MPNLSHINELTIASVEQGDGHCQFWYYAFAQHAHLVILKKVLLPITSEISVWE